MSILVGLPPAERAGEALQVGAVLARTTGRPLLLCAVVPAPWPAGVGRIDVEYQQQLLELAGQALDRARGGLPADVAAELVTVRAGSAPAGLLDVARERGAEVVVLGSSGSGAVGRPTVGSVAERLLHSSPVPVALAPRGLRRRPGATVERITVAFNATPESTALVSATAGLAVRTGAALRIASFAVRPHTMLTAGVGSRAEDAVAAEWARDVERAQLAAAPEGTDTVIAHGHDWDEAFDALDWHDGDLLVVGSSTAGPLARVFLGSRAAKIVRHSPVPVLMVPQGQPSLLA